MGTEAGEVHTHEYDDGLLVRTVALREPEWTPEQYELAVALTEYEAGLGRHGLPLAETMSADADPDNPNGKYSYRVMPPSRDWYDYAVEVEQKKPDWSGDNYLAARKFVAVKVER